MQKTAPSPSQTYTISDLDKLDFSGTPLAVLGFPVRHSISPQMHNAALDAMNENGRYAGWRYFKFEVEPERLSEALPLLHQAGFRGVNLTIPHKVMAVDLIESVDPSAKRMGAVNTLRWAPGGYMGFNTDGFGMESAIQEKLGKQLHNAEIILLGAGGASRAAAFQCIESGCKQLWIGNRNQARLGELLEIIQRHFPEAQVKGFDLTSDSNVCDRPDLIINATSLGLKADDPLPMDITRFESVGGVYDMIYNPSQTPLLKQAEQLGIPNANGLSMLVWQGVRALEIWTEDSVPADVMAQAAANALKVTY